VFNETRQCLSQGNTNGALAVLENALDDPGLAESRPEIYKGITTVMLMAGRLDDVKARLARDFKAAPTLSGPCLGAVRGHYLRQGDRDSAHVWVEHLLNLALEDRMSATLRGWQAEEYLHRKEHDRVLALAKTAVQELPGEHVAAAVGSVLVRAVKGGEADMAGQLLELLATVPDGGTRLEELVAVYRIELDATDGRLAEAIDGFAAFLDGGGLPACRYIFTTLSEHAQKKGDRATIDKLCTTVLGEPDADEGMRALAVSTYCGAAAAAEHAGEYPERVARLLDAGVSPTIIQAPFVRDFRGVIRGGDTNAVRSMIATAEKLAELSDDARAKDECLGLALDGYVTLDDYKKAVAMVDAGFRRDNASWQTVMVPKLRAHLAMEEGRSEEAIRYFREFMRAAAAAEESPDSAMLNKTLGMNAARIGDLWRGAGETTEKAKAATIEARDYYTRALNAPRLSDEMKRDIEEALTRIAAQLGAP